VQIRKATEYDYDEIWSIFKQIIESGDTLVFDPDTPKSDLKTYWFADQMETFVAVDSDQILGSHMIKPNQIGLGNHVANCGYIVHPDARRKGVGKFMCAHSIETAKDLGYKSIQFNIVVSVNVGAVKLWEKFGFKIIGTTPKAFRHKTLGLVDTYMMHKELDVDE
jgi:L-amino acid N-acyltransferase YncA